MRNGSRVSRPKNPSAEAPIGPVRCTPLAGCYTAARKRLGKPVIDAMSGTAGLARTPGWAVAILLAGAFLGGMGSARAATVMTVCEAPKGKSVAVGGPSGWSDEGLPGATLTFTTDAVDGFDVATKSASTDTTAKKEGARIRRAFGNEDGAMTLVAEYPLGTVETYQLSLDGAGNGSLIMASLKNRVVGVTKGSLFEAACRRPAG